MDGILTAFDTWTEETDWMDAALCKEIDADMFYPEPMVVAYDAKKVCAMCEVRLECLTYALENNEEHGIWGGTAPWERRLMRKGRRV